MSIIITDDFTGENLTPEQAATVGVHVAVTLIPSGDIIEKRFTWTIKKTTSNINDNLVYKRIKARIATMMSRISGEVDTSKTDIETQERI